MIEWEQISKKETIKKLYIVGSGAKNTFLSRLTKEGTGKYFKNVDSELAEFFGVDYRKDFLNL